MGCSCTKYNSASAIVKGNKLSDIRSNIITVRKNNCLESTDIKMEIQKKDSHPKRNYFYVIQRRTWTIILDFLPYKDLCQAGQLNKYKFNHVKFFRFLNTAAKSQELLKKFYKNKKKISDEFSIIKKNMINPLTVINNSQNISNHFNYTTINNFNKTLDTLNLNYNQYYKEFVPEGNFNSNIKNFSKINFKNIPTFKDRAQRAEGDNNTVNYFMKNETLFSNEQKQNYSLNFNDIKYPKINSRKISDFKNDKNSKNNSIEHCYSSKNSMSLEYPNSNITPSFSKEINFNQSAERELIINFVKSSSYLNTRERFLNYSGKLKKIKTISKYNSRRESKSARQLRLVDRVSPVNSRRFKS
jgi:hypothetical protein